MNGKKLREIANLINKLLVVHEMAQNIFNNKLEELDPVTIIVSSVGKSVVDASLTRTAVKLTKELKEKVNEL